MSFLKARFLVPQVIVAVTALCSLLLLSCETPTRSSENPPAVIGDEPTADELEASGLQKTILIQSFPQGGILELNNEFVGTTPMRLTVKTGAGGSWTSYGSRANKFVLKCSSADGGVWEEKVWLVGQRVPDRILFRIGGDAPISIR